MSERSMKIAGAERRRARRNPTVSSLRREQHEQNAQLKYEDRGETVAIMSKRGIAKRLQEMAAAQGVRGDEQLTRAEAEKFMSLTHDEKNTLTLIATGYPMRNATSVLSAIKLKLDKTIPPAVTEKTDASQVTVIVKTAQDPFEYEVQDTTSTTLQKN